MNAPSSSMATAVCGLQFGDEGKGQIVDLLAAEHQLVARYNGGANAGHTVRVGEDRVALHLVPSGILLPGVTNVVGNGVALDPESFLKEIDGLREHGVAVGDNLKLSDRAHLVMPYHKTEEALREAAARKLAGEGGAIGTTGRGIGPTYADKAHRVAALRVGDLADLDRVRVRLADITAVKNAMLKGLAELAEVPYEPIEAAPLVERLAASAERLQSFVCDTGELLRSSLAAGRRVLFEGAHSALLDIDHGTYPFVTSSPCTALGIGQGAGVPPACIGQVWGVAKAYTSRVGGGPFPTELFGAVADDLRERGNEYGTSTGRPRRIGWIDLVALRYAASLAGVTHLALTGLSVLSGLSEIRACVGYTLGGGELQGVPPTADQWAEVEPVYETLPGFDEVLADYGCYADLPANARALVDRIEAAVAPVAMVCVGPRREQVLKRG